MAKNPLEQLISNAPRYADYNPSEERQDTNIIDAGTTPTVVQPYDKTNKWLRFANLLKKTPEVYEMGVDVMQDRAAEKVATMSEGEFQEAYEKIIGGDQGTRDLFGYNKAHQEKIVERAYAEVVPLEMKDLVTDFESRLNDFGSIADFDDAVNTAVDDYFTELDERFNQSTFANNAHQLLRTGKEAKIKIQLHDSYEAQAKEFIEAQSLDNVLNTLKDMNGNYDIDVDGNEIDMGNVLTKQYNGILGANGGDKGRANQTVVQGVGNQIKALLSTGTTQDLEDAQELFDETFNSDILVSGKNIFETTEALKLEIDLRQSLKLADDNYMEIAKRTLEQDFLFPYLGQILRSEDIQEQERLYKELDDALIAQPDNAVLILGRQAIADARKNSAYTRWEHQTKTVNDYEKRVPSTFNADDKLTGGLISKMDLSPEQQSFFYKLEEDQNTVTLLPDFQTLDDEWNAEYDRLKREKLKALFDEDPDLTTVDERIGQIYKEAQTESTAFMEDRINNLVKRQEPIQAHQKLKEQALALGVSPLQIERTEKLPPSTRTEELNKLLDSRRERALDNISEKNKQGNLQAKINRSDFEETVENINTLRVTDSYSSAEDTLADYNKIVNGTNPLFRNEGRGVIRTARTPFEDHLYELGNMYKEGDADQALSGLFKAYEFRGFTEEEISNGYVVSRGSFSQQSARAYGNRFYTSEFESTSKISINLILTADPDGGEMASFAELPILLGGDIANTIEAIENNDVDAFRSVASKIGYTPEQLLTAQKFALTGAGFIETE